MLTRSFRHIHRLIGAQYSSVAENVAAATQRLDDFRTNELNTNNHTVKHVGKFYRISPEDKKAIFGHGGFPKTFEKQIKTFGETCLMIREPAIEIIQLIKESNLQRPTIRYVLYGEDGTGKTLTLAHLLHHAFQNEFILVHVPWVSNWFKRPKETSNSNTHEGYIDLPFDAAAWLLHFKAQNAKFLEKLNLKTSKDYVWSKRESTPAGSTFLELIEHGIARVKFANDTIAALICELKEQATSGKCKVFVAIDGYNAFFHPQTKIVADNKSRVSPDKVTITKPFLDITNYDWCNGICVVTVDRFAVTEEKFESPLPRYQLGKEGFEHLDPFIPVKLENYNEKEYISCIDYYVDRRWIQNVEKGFEDELKYLSNKNPYKLMNVCAPL